MADDAVFKWDAPDPTAPRQRADLPLPTGVRRLALLLAVIVVAVAVVWVSRPEPAPGVAAPPTTTTTSTSSSTTTSTTTTTLPPTTTTTIPGQLPPARPGPPVFPTQVGTSAAKAVIPILDGPAGRMVKSESAPRPFSFAPVVFRVIENPGTGWLKVMLPERPNESTGWIAAKDVTITTHEYSIDIDLAARVITVYQGKDIFLQSPVVIGTDVTPTPLGDFYTTEAVKNANPYDSYGTYIIGLSAHSEVFSSFGAGDGQVGIHGTNAPGLRGSAVSNGCIRLANEDITKLALTLPMGVPVRVHRPDPNQAPAT